MHFETKMKKYIAVKGAKGWDKGHKDKTQRGVCQGLWGEEIRSNNGKPDKNNQTNVGALFAKKTSFMF